MTASYPSTKTVSNVQTVIIYDQFGQDSIGFLVIDHDVSHLDGCYINASDCDDDKAEELDKLVHEYDPQGEYVRSRPRLEAFPVEAVKAGAKVIVCGFVP